MNDIILRVFGRHHPDPQARVKTVHRILASPRVVAAWHTLYGLTRITTGEMYRLAPSEENPWEKRRQ